LFEVRHPAGLAAEATARERGTIRVIAGHLHVGRYITADAIPRQRERRELNPRRGESENSVGL
jgi:hypothetical protein